MQNSLWRSAPIEESPCHARRSPLPASGPRLRLVNEVTSIANAHVDNSNVWIEGMRESAVARALARNHHEAQEHEILDYSWKLDYDALYSLLDTPGYLLARATLYGSRTPRNGPVFRHAERAGFEVVLSDRNRFGRETDVDPAIIEALEIAAERLPRPEQHRIVLVSGDAHFAPAVSKLTGRGFEVTVMSWSHSLAWALRKAASTVVLLDPFLDQLRLRTAA